MGIIHHVIFAAYPHNGTCNMTNIVFYRLIKRKSECIYRCWVELINEFVLFNSFLYNKIPPCNSR